MQLYFDLFCIKISSKILKLLFKGFCYGKQTNKGRERGERKSPPLKTESVPKRNFIALFIFIAEFLDVQKEAQSRVQE